MLIAFYNDEVIVPAELEELFEFLEDSPWTVRINLDETCYYICPSEDYEYGLTPCMPSLEELAAWLAKHETELRENWERYVEENQ